MRDQRENDVDEETEALMERVFPSGKLGASDLSAGRIFAVIPENLIGSDLNDFASFMEQVFEAGEGLDLVVEALAEAQSEKTTSSRRMEVIIPESLLGEAPGSTAAFLDRVFDAFEEIDQVLSVIRNVDNDLPELHMETETKSRAGELNEARQYLRAVDRVSTNQEKLQLMIRQTRHELRRLRPFRLAKQRPGQMLASIRESGELPTLHYVVEFLHSIHLAAESFEKIGIPKPHIRDYLEFLYRMEDWKEMEALVGRLRHAVRRYAMEEAGNQK